MWQGSPKQLDMERPRRVCPACKAFDPPIQPAYGCPECGEGGVAADGWEPGKPCPSCGADAVGLATEEACAFCGQAEVEELKVKTCDWCGAVLVWQSYHWEYHNCPKAPRSQYQAVSRKDWTQGGQEKVAFLRLTCRAQEQRVKINGRFCQGWQRAVEEWHAGNKDAFKECFVCAVTWGRNPGAVEATGVEPYTHQTRIQLESR